MEDKKKSTMFEKGTKYCNDLKTGTGRRKDGTNGKLSDTDKAFRQGWLRARRDGADVHWAKDNPDYYNQRLAERKQKKEEYKNKSLNKSNYNYDSIFDT